MKFLVLASNSFSGSNLVKTLLQNHIETIGISRSPELASCFATYRWLPESCQQYFTFYQANINYDVEKIIDLIHHHHITHIVNFAAQAMGA